MGGKGQNIFFNRQIRNEVFILKTYSVIVFQIVPFSFFGKVIDIGPIMKRHETIAVIINICT